MSIYAKFNKFIKEYYFHSGNIGEDVFMIVDDSTMDEFEIKYGINKQVLQQQVRRKFCETWRDALEIIDGVPQIFGLVAIQIYIGFKRECDTDIGVTAREYNPRLAKYFGVPENVIGKLYAETQDVMWGTLKKWCEDNNYHIDIPSPRGYTGCYVQYPLSQTLMRKEDLKKVPFLFYKSGLRRGEVLSFEDFRGLIENSDSGVNVSTNYYNLKKRLKAQKRLDSLYRQIFYYYNYKWDGNYPEIKTQEVQKIESKHIDDREYILDEDLETFTIYDGGQPLNSYQMDDYKFFDKITEDGYSLLYKKIMIFSLNDGYGDWLYTRYLEVGKPYLVVCQHKSLFEEDIGVLDPVFTRSKDDYAVQIFKVTPVVTAKDHYRWKSFFRKKEIPFQVTGGLKLSRKTWMSSVGPRVIFDKECEIYINGEKSIISKDRMELDYRDKPVDRYIFKMHGFSPVSIEISEPKEDQQLCSSGWKVDKEQKIWEPVIDADKCEIAGLKCTFKDRVEKASIRSWIDTHNSYSETDSDTLVIKAIKRGRNGIRY